MSGSQFRLTLSLHKEANNGPVYCKMDGQRFAQQRTVKLLADAKYKIHINLRPKKTVRGVSLLERNVEVTEIPATDEDTSASNYSGTFVLDVLNPTKKGKREMVPIIIQLDKGCAFTANLQTKVYKANSTQHCDWGTTVHSIEYECAMDPQSSVVKIIKETFR